MVVMVITFLSSESSPSPPSSFSPTDDVGDQSFASFPRYLASLVLRVGPSCSTFQSRRIYVSSIGKNKDETREEKNSRRRDVFWDQDLPSPTFDQGRRSLERQHQRRSSE